MDAAMDGQFTNRLNDSLVWLPEHGMGYFAVRESDAPYDADYFAKYEGYAQTELGINITGYRVDLVNKYTTGPVVDIGIGCGAFIERRGKNTLGYDINPEGVEWLRRRHLFAGPYSSEGVESITCWDSLEHIADPKALLDRVQQYVFMSLPIFRDAAHVLKSKHYRRDEHYWYFTRDGLVRWMGEHGFELAEESDMETRMGREDIGTFVFRRIA